MFTKTNNTNASTATPRQSDRQLTKKWGPAVIGHGYSMVPSLIFQAQARLGLNATQLALLLHLVDYWWHRDQLPFPSKATLSQRIGLGERQIQRYLSELEQAGFIKRIERFAGHKGQLSNSYDLTGLVHKLKKLEPEFSKVRKQAKEQAKNVAKPGGLALHAAKDSGQNDE